MATVTLLDERGRLIELAGLGVKEWPLVGYQGDSLLLSVPGKDHGYGNTPLRDNQRAIHVVPLAKVSKIIVTE